MAAVPLTLESRFARAIISAADAVDIGDVAAPPGRLRASLRTHFHGTTVSGVCSEASTFGRLVARRYGDAKRARIIVGHVRVDQRRWAVTVAADAIPSGVWILELEYQDRWGMTRAALRLSDESARIIPPALRRMVVTRSLKDRWLVRVRDPLGERIRKKARRIFRA